MSRPDVRSRGDEESEPRRSLPVAMEVDEHVASTIESTAIESRNQTFYEEVQRLLRCESRESCNHRHSTGIGGVHLAKEDGTNFIFPRSNCTIVCADGGKVHLNRLHALALSSYLSVILLKDYRRDNAKDEVDLSYFKAVEVTDALELANLVIQRMHFDKIPLSAASLPPMPLMCAFRVLHVASYINLHYLLVPLSDYIDKHITTEHLVYGYKIAKGTCADLSKRLWRRILNGFMSLYENRTFLHLSKYDMENLIRDPTLNVFWTFDDVLMRVYNDYHKQKQIQQAFRDRIQEAVAMVSSTEEIKHETPVADNDSDSQPPVDQVRNEPRDFLVRRLETGALIPIVPIKKESVEPPPVPAITTTAPSRPTLPITTTRSTMPSTSTPASTSTTIGALNGIGLSRLPRSIVLCTGGWGDNGPTDRVEVYDYHREQWNPPAHPSVVETVRAYHGLHVNDYGILCMGGFNGRQNFRSASLFNFETMSWKYICASVDIRCYVSIGTLDKDHIIACGGYTGQMRLRSTEIYSFSENEWQRVGPMNVVRSDARAVTLGSAANGTCRVYMIGGFDGRQCHKSLEYYDPVRDEWIAERNSMNTKRSGVGAVGIGENVIIAMGGFNGANRLSSAEFYDTREGIWHELGNLNTFRSNFGSCCLEDEPWVFGGYNNERTIADCERFDSRTNRWVSMPNMNGTRSALASITIERSDFIRKVIQRSSNVPLSVVWDESMGAFVPSNNHNTVSS